MRGCANPTLSYTRELAKSYKENYDFFLCVLYVAKSSCFSRNAGA